MNWNGNADVIMGKADMTFSLIESAHRKCIYEGYMQLWTSYLGMYFLDCIYIDNVAHIWEHCINVDDLNSYDQ